ncbi:ABC transporter permease [Rhodospirillaceae bacterium SYSU D60014]|uniref:ABC transporter permease n=1 Tax=Virgifigura deserti TaxID=2268457 RepID=UPI000E65FCD4
MRFVRRNGLFLSGYLLVAVTVWIVFMIVLPQLYMVDFSFRPNLPLNEIGGPDDKYTLENYRYLVFGRPTDEALLNWLHLEVFFRTIIASICVTLLDFCLCYPLAYYMAQVARGGRTRLLLLLLILPFWVNEILRAFAFRLLFASGGMINTALLGLGLIEQPIDFLRADVALYAGLSYAYILLMMFPIYNAVESLDHNQVEAARDLGAPWWHIHLFVVMPFAKPGIAAGCTMVFMLSAGALAVPQILGGPSSLWFTQVIYDWFYQGGNWPQGSAYAFVLLIACILFVLLVMRLFKVGLGEIAR